MSELEENLLELKTDAGEACSSRLTDFIEHVQEPLEVTSRWQVLCLGVFALVLVLVIVVLGSL
jgi:hypothetical protein